MKKKEVVIHGLYYANVSGRRATVRIEREAPYGGWYATNQETGRTIHIRTAQRLTRPL